MNQPDYKIKLSVIIVTHNCLSFLKACINSIKVFSDLGEALEIIVVDNGFDNTYEWLISNQPDILTIKCENKGFGHANNIGASRASGEYLLFLNPDTELIEPVFNYAIELFEQSPCLAAFGFQLLDNREKRGNSFGMRFTPTIGDELMFKICRMLNLFLPSKMFTSGADLFIRTSVFDAIGGFDEKIFLYCEESDITERIIRLGYSVGFFKEKRIIHREGKTADFKLSEQYLIELKSREYFCQKYKYDFYRYGRKEYIYCRFKQLIFAICGKRTRSKEYSLIVNEWKNKLNKEGV